MPAQLDTARAGGERHSQEWSPLPLRAPLNIENKAGVHFLKGAFVELLKSWNYSKSCSWKEQGLHPSPSAQTPAACSPPFHGWNTSCSCPGAAHCGQPCAGGSTACCDRGKQQQEAQSLFRKLTLRLDLQRTGMGQRCSEGGNAGGCWSSHVLLTSAKSCPKLQPRKFPVQLSANHSFAQADP